MEVSFCVTSLSGEKVRALAEARRVSREWVVVVIPTRTPKSGIVSVFTPMFPFFPEEALANMKRSGMFALSEPGALDAALASAELTRHEDETIECPIVFEDGNAAERAFLGAGPTQLAIGHSGEAVVAEAVRSALEPFINANGRVVPSRLVSRGARPKVTPTALDKGQCYPGKLLAAVVRGSWPLRRERKCMQRW
jgi:hypothetical protein